MRLSQDTKDLMLNAAANAGLAEPLIGNQYCPECGFKECRCFDRKKYKTVGGNTK
jgi:hypothetical protein